MSDLPASVMTDPEYPCRLVTTRSCPESCGGVRADRPCARYGRFRDAIANAIPTALTATPHVGVGTSRRMKIADAVLPVVEAEFDWISRALADTQRALRAQIVEASELRAKIQAVRDLHRGEAIRGATRCSSCYVGDFNDYDRADAALWPCPTIKAAGQEGT
jgi:hypothetical protein